MKVDRELREAAHHPKKFDAIYPRMEANSIQS